MSPDDFLIEVAPNNGKPQRLVEVVYFDERIRDRFDTDSRRSRASFINGIVEQFHLAGEDLNWMHSRLTDLADQADGERDDAVRGILNDDRDKALEQTPPEIVSDAEAFLGGDHLLNGVIEDITELGVAGETELSLTTYLVGTSRLLSKPLACIVQGPSSSGKSYLIDTVCKLFPAEAIIQATQMTPQALFHMPPDSLEHRFVVAGERSRRENDDTAECTRALREMISAGKLVKLMPMKVGDDMVTATLEQKGPIAYIESTTLADIFDEDRNRCLVCNTDERCDQTRRIVKTLAACYSGNGRQSHVDAIIQRHQTAQRLLEPFEVVVPFAGRLGELFPVERVEVRRAFPQTVGMIQAIALLLQKQRETDSHGRLVATHDDYRHARQLLARPVARSVGRGVSDGALRFYDRLSNAVGDHVFTTTDVAQHDGSSERSIRGWLTELQKAGTVNVIEAHRGPKPARWKLTDKEPDSVDCLPALSDVFPGE